MTFLGASSEGPTWHGENRAEEDFRGPAGRTDRRAAAPASATRRGRSKREGRKKKKTERERKRERDCCFGGTSVRAMGG